VTHGTFYDILQQYSTPSQTIGEGKFGGRLTLDRHEGLVDDLDIQKSIKSLVRDGALPHNRDGHQLFMFHMPPDVLVTKGASLSCREFFGYHGSVKVGATPYYYGVMPDQGGLCEKLLTWGTPNATYDQLGRTTMVASHELAEAVTDPAVGFANEGVGKSPLGPPLGWLDVVSYGEVADMCQYANATVGPWTVQKVWSESDGNCVGRLGEYNGTASTR
jgi:hypothetical protein